MYTAFLQERATPWGIEQSHQPSVGCLAHLLEMIQHEIERDSAKGPITQQKVLKWLKVRSPARQL